LEPEGEFFTEWCELFEDCAVSPDRSRCGWVGGVCCSFIAGIRIFSRTARQIQSIKEDLSAEKRIFQTLQNELTSDRINQSRLSYFIAMVLMCGETRRKLRVLVIFEP